VPPVQTQTCSSVKREDEKISKVIDHVLTQVFGKEATDLIYKHLERAHSLKRNEVASKIDVFSKGLEEFLNSGAYAVEQKILEDIYSSYGLLRRLETEKHQMGSDFVDQIKCLVRKA
jgi:hypothetical protein